MADKSFLKSRSDELKACHQAKVSSKATIHLARIVQFNTNNTMVCRSDDGILFERVTQPSLLATPSGAGHRPSAVRGSLVVIARIQGNPPHDIGICTVQVPDDNDTTNVVKDPLKKKPIPEGSFYIDTIAGNRILISSAGLIELVRDNGFTGMKLYEHNLQLHGKTTLLKHSGYRRELNFSSILNGDTIPDMTPLSDMKIVETFRPTIRNPIKKDRFRMEAGVVDDEGGIYTYKILNVDPPYNTIFELRIEDNGTFALSFYKPDGTSTSETAQLLFDSADGSLVGHMASEKWQASIKSDGSMKVSLGGGNATLSVGADGAITLGNKQCALTLGADGALSVQNKFGGFEVDPIGTTKLTASTNFGFVGKGAAAALATATMGGLVTGNPASSVDPLTGKPDMADPLFMVTAG